MTDQQFLEEITKAHDLVVFGSPLQGTELLEDVMEALRHKVVKITPAMTTDITPTATVRGFAVGHNKIHHYAVVDHLPLGTKLYVKDYGDTNHG